jgi:hypothetical protein
VSTGHAQFAAAIPTSCGPRRRPALAVDATSTLTVVVVGRKDRSR